MKRKIIILLAVLAVFPSAQVAAADAGSCYSIADGDARTFCLARAHRDPGRCYSIQDSSLRSQCLAEVRK